MGSPGRCSHLCRCMYGSPGDRDWVIAVLVVDSRIGSLTPTPALCCGQPLPGGSSLCPMPLSACQSQPFLHVLGQVAGGHSLPLKDSDDSLLGPWGCCLFSHLSPSWPGSSWKPLGPPLIFVCLHGPWWAYWINEQAGTNPESLGQSCLLDITDHGHLG